jgi:hypothetical protein
LFLWLFNDVKIRFFAPKKKISSTNVSKNPTNVQFLSTNGTKKARQAYRAGSIYGKTIRLSVWQAGGGFVLLDDLLYPCRALGHENMDCRHLVEVPALGCLVRPLQALQQAVKLRA